MGIEEINLKIFEKLMENDFDYSKTLLDHDCLNIHQVNIISKQLVSFYKVTFVEEGIDRIDTISIYIFLSFVSLLKQIFKNISYDSKIKSLDQIIELLDKILPYLKIKRQDLLDL